MIRSVTLLFLGVLVTAYFSAAAVATAFIGGTENSIHKIARLWARILLKLSGVKVEVLGVEHVLRDRPQIFMSNHQSGFDIFIVLAYIPGQFRWIAKKELFRIPVFSLAMKKAGYIEIDRQHRDQAMMSLNRAAQKIREGKSVMSFPEGTRSRDGQIKPFQTRHVSSRPPGRSADCSRHNRGSLGDHAQTFPPYLSRQNSPDHWSSHRRTALYAGD